MQILALSDIHAEEMVIDRLRAILSKKTYDLILLAGDLTDIGPVSFVEDLLEPMDKVYAIHGNMDNEQVIDILEKRNVSVHKKRVRVGDYYLVGYGGSNPTPFNTPVEYEEEQIAKELGEMRIDKKTILMTHAPAYGVLDQVQGVSVGSSAIKAVVNSKQPMVHICGHIHEQEGEMMSGDTRVIKLGPAMRMRAAEISLVEDVKVNFISLGGVG
ncbi:metallophosphoesterase family protein [Candidatus Micrarchaeota archaeon]|nr:metallophosphoesterase family protein [Candidatus Micrarchaeota archaeon]